MLFDKIFYISRNLQDKDTFSKSDPMCVLFTKDTRSGSYHEVRQSRKWNSYSSRKILTVKCVYCVNNKTCLFSYTDLLYSEEYIYKMNLHVQEQVQYIAYLKHEYFKNFEKKLMSLTLRDICKYVLIKPTLIHKTCD